MPVVMVCHFCQPPMLPTVMVPIGVPPRLSRRSSIRPCTPSPTSEATRAANWVAGVPEKLTWSNCSQSPPLIQPMFLPPPSSSVSWDSVPCWLVEFSAWIVLYASVPPFGSATVGDGSPDGDGDGDGDGERA